MKILLALLMVIVGVTPSLGGEQSASTPFDSGIKFTPQGRIDALVQSKFRRLKIEPATICSDSTFVRRAYLDVIGTLPTADEAEQFLLDNDPRKRHKLIDRLLERDEFADYWALKWCDLLRVKSEFPINLWPNAVQAYHRWIHTAVKQNMPYDRFARDLLTSSGSNFRDPQVNFYRAVQNTQPNTLATAVALTFMGTRVKNLPPQRRDQLAVFFSRVSYKSTDEWKEQIVFFDPFAKPPDNLPTSVVFPDGTSRSLSPHEDPRRLFADWLIQRRNPYFARTMANRAWCWLLGRGIIEPADDLRPDNRPSNPELLNYLEKEFVASKYDVKHLFRLILNSRTYQLSCIPRSSDPQAAAQFAYYPVRRLDAEVLADALCQISGTTEEYSSLIPEPFTFIPEDQRSIALADGSITSPFLEMFGRPPRDTGLMDERDNRPSSAGELHLLNSSHIRNKIERSSKLRKLMRSGRTPIENVKNLYLTILSRPPTDEELQVLKKYTESGQVKRWEVPIDIAWALVNSAEFLYRH